MILAIYQTIIEFFEQLEEILGWISSTNLYEIFARWDAINYPTIRAGRQIFLHSLRRLSDEKKLVYVLVPKRTMKDHGYFILKHGETHQNKRQVEAFGKIYNTLADCAREPRDTISKFGGKNDKE